MSVDAFDDILLEDTFVLSWHYASDSLTFSVLASLLQSHPEATPPVSGDWACYRPGLIRFSSVSSVSGLLPQDAVLPTQDADGSLDYGCIDELSILRPGEYRIAGEFGVVTVAAREAALVLGVAA
ncbi:hypothetical protein [Pseudoxanthomonas sp. KAs_5_3]|uniref:hypothetical protein n=1 Tax=Pseudoxanthomonas sp. KAs_5_3 TaxID=2067658 RepID=UPI000B887CCC|nr:hypothetical protein [Pseudoxanthomonas sp. KAs_5_3]PPJ43924.1 hypothetical protein C0063_12365 [Pseudoxanthomonas sp. KAs_5_3]